MMEFLAIIGLIVLGLAIFTGGGILGWIFKGIGASLNCYSTGGAHA